MKLAKFFLAFTCLFSSYVAMTPSETLGVSAEETIEKIENTNPFEDLIGDDQFKVDYLNGAYKYDLNKEIQFLNFFEYKYENSFTPSFGLYVYFYNPNYSNVPKVFSDKNKIQLSIDGTNYAKYNLIPVSVSTGDIANLFYKFKVNIDEGFHSQLNSSQRTYKVSGIELDLSKSSSIIELEIATTFTYSGYAKGCNGNEESTLTCEKEGLETIYLKVYAGYKRSSYINTGLTKAIDLHYAYFEIPNKYLNTYGEPYGVSYEFYDCYLDKGIWNIDKDDYYMEDNMWRSNDDSNNTQCYAEDPFTFNNQAGNEYTEWLWQVNSIVTPPNLDGNAGQSDAAVTRVCKENKYSSFDFSNNSLYSQKSISNNPNRESHAKPGYKYNENSWRFTPGVLGERLFRKDEWNSVITDNELEACLNKYGLDYFSSKSNQKYSGVITSTIDDLTSPVVPNIEEPNYSSWDAILNQIVNKTGNQPWGRTQTDTDVWDSVPAFQRVTTYEDSNGSNYVINKNDVSHFNTMLEATNAKDTTMCILHFGETEYYTAPIYFRRSAFAVGFKYQKIGYSAFPHIIDQFDILSLSFKMQDEITVIPVVSEPSRIVPQVDHPVDDRPETENWWESLLSATKLNLRRIIGIVAGVILVFVALIVISKVIGLISTKRALKANNLAIKESKRRRRDRNKHESE